MLWTLSKKVFKPNNERLDLITKREMHSESKCSETDEVQVSIVSSLTNIFDIIETFNVRLAQISFYQIWMDSPIEE